MGLDDEGLDRWIRFDCERDAEIVDLIINPQMDLSI